MYTLFDEDAGQKHLGTQSVFWSFGPKEFKAPSRIQFKLIAMRVVEGGKDIYWLGQSPVIQFDPKLEYEAPDDILVQSSTCYTDVLTEHSKHNFAIAKDQTPLEINMRYLQDLFPDLGILASIWPLSQYECTCNGIAHVFVESTLTTIQSYKPTSMATTASSKVATTEKLATTEFPLEAEYVDPEDSGIASTLVRYGHFCRNIHAFDVDGVPQSSEPPIQMTLYELKSPSSANTLHLAVHSSQQYQYLVAMAVNQKGIPTGHFHHQVCKDPRSKHQGLHQLNRYCTRTNTKHGEKWGVRAIEHICSASGTHH